jgi:stage II sporulation protein AA (anti-sigma F factor antagonist)
MSGATIVIRGPLDFATASEHLDALTDATSGAQAVLVDLSECDFLDSSGLALLVRSAQRARRNGGSLHLRAPTPAVRRLLAFARLEDALPSL